MNIEIAGMTFVLYILTLMVVLVYLGLKAWQTRIVSAAEVARDEAYRKLAAEAVATQKKTADELADLRVRVASMEKILRDVE